MAPDVPTYCWAPIDVPDRVYKEEGGEEEPGAPQHHAQPDQHQRLINHSSMQLGIQWSKGQK